MRIPAHLCVECHCVMLTIYALTMSFWLHSSGQAKANCVCSFLQNGIIWQLFLLQRADCRGQLFIPPGQVHIMHRLFVLQILMSLSNTFISPNRAKTLYSCSGLHKQHLQTENGSVHRLFCGVFLLRLYCCNLKDRYQYRKHFFHEVWNEKHFPIKKA